MLALFLQLKCRNPVIRERKCGNILFKNYTKCFTWHEKMEIYAFDNYLDKHSDHSSLCAWSPGSHFWALESFHVIFFVFICFGFSLGALCVSQIHFQCFDNLAFGGIATHWQPPQSQPAPFSVSVFLGRLKLLRQNVNPYGQPDHKKRSFYTSLTSFRKISLAFHQRCHPRKIDVLIP